jgi:hypothetical protein
VLEILDNDALLGRSGDRCRKWERLARKHS